MKKIRIFVGDDVRYIIDRGGNETNGFKMLNKTEPDGTEHKSQLGILTEVFERIFLLFFFGAQSAWTRDVKQKKSGGEVSIDSEKLSTTFTLKTKKQTEKLVEAEPVAEQPIVGSRIIGATAPVPMRLLMPKFVKVPEADAKVKFTYNQNRKELIVELVEVNTVNEVKAKKFVDALEEELEAAADRMSKVYDVANRTRMETCLKCFFDTLHVNNLSVVAGNEAVLMYRIYRHACDTYPQFRELSAYKQNEVLDQGVCNARACGRGSRDIHVFAKGTYEALEANGLTRKVYRADFVTGRYFTFEKVWENRRNIVRQVNPRKAPVIVSELIFSDYQYGRKDKDGNWIYALRTSMQPYDLWHLLAVGNGKEVANEVSFL